MNRFQSGVTLAALFVSAVACGQDRTQSWVRIPAGSFVMGTEIENITFLKEKYDVGFRGVFENETPPKTVKIRAFGLDRYEVTNRLFAEFVRANPKWSPGRMAAEEHNGDYLRHWQDGGYPNDRGEWPVVFITWEAAQAFCRHVGGRLPTEVEWEYAARAGDSREFPWGDEMPSPEMANYSASAVGSPKAVGS